LWLVWLDPLASYRLVGNRRGANFSVRVSRQDQSEMDADLWLLLSGLTAGPLPIGFGLAFSQFNFLVDDCFASFNKHLEY
jgi:hypothetical protein